MLWIRNEVNEMGLKRIISTSLFLVSMASFGQGIPVYDNASVLTAIQQLLAWEKQYQQMYQQYMNQLQQIQQQQQQIANMSGTRNLGLINNGITNSVISSDIQQQLTNANNKQALIQTTSQQLKNMLQASQGRSAQIQSLMSNINQTNDSKGISELAARIQAEQVMATNEGKEAQLLNQLNALQRQQQDEDLRNQSIKNLSKPSGAIGR
jgi:type IV secretion system protein VirB5